MILLQGDSVNQRAKATFVVAAATEIEQVKHLRAENARLRELLADLVLRNDELQSEVRNISIRS